MSELNIWNDSFSDIQAPTATGKPLMNGIAPPPLIPPLPRPWAQADDEIWVDLSDATIHDPTTNAKCWQAIVRNNWNSEMNAPILFNYESSIVYVERNDKGLPLIRQLTPDFLSNKLSGWVNWCRGVKALATPPMRSIRDVMATFEGYKHLPTLTRIVSIPVFSSAGKLQTTPGYNRESGVLYLPPAGFEALPVPATITPEILEAAKAALAEVLIDFPFTSKGDETHAYALAFLPVVRDMIDGPTPNHVIEASKNGSGKDLLARALLGISIGTINATADPVEEVEMRKVITSFALFGKQVFYLANVNRKLDSASLAAAIADQNWADRPLGRTAMLEMIIRMIWVTTGTNMQLHREHARRGLRCRLTPSAPHPELRPRESYKHPDLLDYVLENRPRLLQAIHIICKHAIDQGLPRQRQILGTFEKWSHVIGSILACAGYPDFLANAREFQAAAAQDTNSHASFCAAWFADAEKLKATSPDPLHRAGKFKTSELLGIARNIEGMPITGRSERAQMTSLGMYLAAHHQDPVAWPDEDPDSPYLEHVFQLEENGVSKGSRLWSIFKTDSIKKPDMQ